MSNNDTTTKSPARIQFLTDVLTTAVEGGIGYWSRAEDYCWSVEDPAERGVTLHVSAEDIEPGDLTLPFGHSTGTDSWSGETIPFYTVRVGLPDIARGVGIVTRGEAGVASDYVGRIHGASIENDCGDMDALDADIVVQAAIFGKVIYG